MSQPIPSKPVEATEVEPRPKATLGELLSLVRMADDGVLDSELDLEELGRDLRDKVDGCVEFIFYNRSRAAAVSAMAKLLTAKATAFANAADRLESHIAFRLAQDKAERAARGEPVDAKYRVAGVQFELVATTSERAVPLVEPTPALYLRFKDLMRRSYDWDKNALKRALRAGNVEVKAYAEIKKIPQVEIKPKG